MPRIDEDIEKLDSSDFASEEPRAITLLPKDFRQTIAAVLKLLDRDLAPWRHPWDESLWPSNFVTHHAYDGSNVSLLLIHQTAREYRTGMWASARQAARRGGRVREGELPTEVTPPFQATPKHAYAVFNLDQIDIDPSRVRDKPTPVRYTPKALRERACAIANAYLTAEGIRVWPGHPGFGAFSLTEQEIVQVPPRAFFPVEDAFWSVLFHELGHSTGARRRLEATGAGPREGGARLAGGLSGLILSRTAMDSPGSQDMRHHARCQSARVPGPEHQVQPWCARRHFSPSRTGTKAAKSLKPLGMDEVGLRKRIDESLLRAGEALAMHPREICRGRRNRQQPTSMQDDRNTLPLAQMSMPRPWRRQTSLTRDSHPVVDSKIGEDLPQVGFQRLGRGALCGDG